jgi:hypothetical protein
MSKDMNYDGVYTISDLLLSIKQFLFSPGDWAIEHWILGSEFGTFFEYSAADYSGVTSFFISLFVFVGIPLSIYTSIHEYYDGVVGYEDSYDEEYNTKQKVRVRKFFSIFYVSLFFSALLYMVLQFSNNGWLVLFSLIVTIFSWILFFNQRKWNK